VDFANMSAFDNPNNGLPRRRETDLLNQYLVKDHRYRLRQFSLPERAMVEGNYVGSLIAENSQIYGEAIINASRWFGSDPGLIQFGDLFKDKIPCLWGLQSGFGSGSIINNGMANQHTTADLVQPLYEPPIAFYVLDGSIFGDWTTENNLLRATLATPNYGLVALYTRRGTWRLDGLALGDTFGDAFLRTANDSTQLRSVRTTALLGDPTLRLNTSAPVANLTAQTDSQTVVLAWNPAADPNTQYLVYRSSNLLLNSAGDFAPLMTSPATVASFVDHAPPAGPKIYLVRPLNLVTTGSGSYTNLGPGAFLRVD
jgi:hypothetical protein